MNIHSRYDATKILYSAPEGLTMRGAVEQAVKARANLTRADLTRADLADANLTRAKLTGANLTDADLAGANLANANLANADLAGANLANANLTRAKLTDADLAGADLTGANLADANLTRADLTGANLTGAKLPQSYLDAVATDIRDILTQAPHEVPALLAVLQEGRVDGSTYEGECACLVGTLSNAGAKGLPQNSNRPAEQWFYGISKGDTPESNVRSAFAVKVIADWMVRS